MSPRKKKLQEEFEKKLLEKFSVEILEEFPTELLKNQGMIPAVATF